MCLLFSCSEEHQGHVLLSHSFRLSICVPQLRNPLTCLAIDIEVVLCSSRFADRISVQLIVVPSACGMFSRFRMWFLSTEPCIYSMMLNLSHLMMGTLLIFTFHCDPNILVG